MAIRLEFKSNSKQAQRDLNQLEKSVEGIDQNVASATKSFNGMAKMAKIAGGALAGIFAAKKITGVVDQFTLIENRIALVTGRTQEMNTTFKELQEISFRARGSLEGIADLYNRLGRTTKRLGVSNDEVLEVTETIQKAITISGSSAESANAAIVQLGQGLAAGALRGQELNSVMEQTPRVASAIAAELGVGVGGLRKLAEQGKITSEVVVAAFQNQASVIDAEFNEVNATVGQGFSQVGASVAFVTREFIQGTGAVEPFAAKLLDLAETLRLMGPEAREFGNILANFSATSYLEQMFDDVGLFSKSPLEKALDSVKEFTEGVDDAFFWVYDRVVGNSWWPDLVDGVVDYTDFLSDALYKVQQFGNAIEGVFKSAYEGVAPLFSSSGSALELGVTLIATDYKKLVIAASSGLAEAASNFLDYLENRFPTLFASISSVAATLFVSAFGTAAGGFALLIGNALAAGVNASDLLTIAGDFAEIVITGLGRAVGALIANLPAFAVGFAKIVVESAFAFGEAILDQLGIIGDVLQVITLGLADGIIGALIAGIFGSRILDVLFGANLTKTILGAFTAALSGVSALFSGLGSVLLPSSVFAGAASGASALLGAYQGIVDVVKKLIAGETTLASVRAVLASTSGALLTTVTSLNIAQLASNVLQWSSVAATTALTAAMGIATAAGRMFWIAISGPLAPFVLGMTLIATLIGSLIPSTAQAAEGAKETADSFNSLKLGLLGLIGNGYNLNINVDIETANPKQAIEEIADYNRELLYDLNREADDSFWFDWADNVSTYLSLKFTSALTSISNGFKKLANSAMLISNELFDTDFDTFAYETRTAIQQELDKIGEGLFIDLDLSESQLKEFVSPEALGELISTRQEIDLIQKELREAEDDWFKNTYAIETLTRQLAQANDELRAQADLLKKQVAAGESFKGLSNAYDTLSKQGTKVNELFGTTVIKAAELVDYLSLAPKKQEDYNKLLLEAAIIEGTIQDILANTTLSREEQRKQLAEQLGLLDSVDASMKSIFDKADIISGIDAADMFGIESADAIKLTAAELERLRQIAVDVEKIEAQISKARDSGNLADLEKYQRSREKLISEGDKIGSMLQVSLANPVSVLLDSLAEAGVVLQASDLAGFDSALRESVVKTSSGLAQMKLEIEAASDVGNWELAASLGVAYEQSAKELGKRVQKALENPRGFDPTALFQRIGVEQLGRVPTKALEEIIAKAKELTEVEKAHQELVEAGNDLTIEQVKQQLGLQGELNELIEESKAMYDFDSLGNDIGGAVVRGIQNGNIGEEITNVFLDAIMNNLQDQISAFATGFLETFFGGLESAEGAGGAVADILKGVLGMDPSVANKNEEAGGVLAEKTQGVITAIKEQTGGLLDGFGNIFGSIFQSITGLFSGGGGGGLGGIASLFAGFFDDGGSIPSNKFGIVGERGPELVSGPSTVYSRAKTARELEKAGGGGKGTGNVTFALEGDFDTRAERSIRQMINSGMIQSALNGAEVENGGSQPIFRTP